MCHHCDYKALLESHGLEGSPNRLRILEIIGNSSSPLSAQEIYETLHRTHNVNRVTVYRILDLLTEKKLTDRIIAGDRSFRYGLAPNANHQRHSHFYCTKCGNMECLSPESLHLDMESLTQTFPGLIEKAEIRLDGICKNCLRRQKSHPHPAHSS